MTNQTPSLPDTVPVQTRCPSQADRGAVSLGTMGIIVCFALAIGVTLILAPLQPPVSGIAACFAVAGLAVGWLAGLTNTPLAPTLLVSLLSASAVANSIPGLAAAVANLPSAPAIAVICAAVAIGFTLARAYGDRLMIK